MSTLLCSRAPTIRFGAWRVASLEAHFRKNAGVQFIRAFAIDGTERKYTSQIDHRHNRDLPFLATRTANAYLNRVRNATIHVCDVLTRLVPMATRPPGLPILQGPTHFAITAECARELESMVTPEIEGYFKQVFCPEEKFYQSLIGASSFANATPGRGVEAYVGPGNWRYANLHVIDPTLVRVFDIDDLEEVLSSGKFFLRKVKTGKSDGLLDAIDLQRT